MCWEGARLSLRCAPSTWQSPEPHLSPLPSPPGIWAVDCFYPSPLSFVQQVGVPGGSGDVSKGSWRSTWAAFSQILWV